MLDHSYDKYELVPTDERQTEVPGPVHHVRIVQIPSVGVSTRPVCYYGEHRLPIYSRVLEIGRKILDEEIAEKPPSKTAPTSAVEVNDGVGGNSTEDSKDFQTLGNGPSMKTDESLVRRRKNYVTR